MKMSDGWYTSRAECAAAVWLLARRGGGDDRMAAMAAAAAAAAVCRRALRDGTQLAGRSAVARGCRRRERRAASPTRAVREAKSAGEGRGEGREGAREERPERRTFGTFSRALSGRRRRAWRRRGKGSLKCAAARQSDRRSTSQFVWKTAHLLAPKEKLIWHRVPNLVLSFAKPTTTRGARRFDVATRFPRRVISRVARDAPSPRAIGRDERAPRAARRVGGTRAAVARAARREGRRRAPRRAPTRECGGRVAVGDAVVVGGRERHPGQARVVRVQAPGGGQLVLARRPQRGGRVRRPRARAGEDTAQGDRCAPHPTSFRDRPATRSRDLEGSPSRAASSVVHRVTRSLTPSHAHPLYA